MSDLSALLEVAELETTTAPAAENAGSDVNVETETETETETEIESQNPDNGVKETDIEQEPSKDETVPAEDSTQIDINRLRSYIRELRQENAEISNKLEKVGQQQQQQPAEQKQEEVKFRILYDEDGNQVKIPLEQPKVEVKVQETEYDKLKAELQATVAMKQPFAGTMYAMMKLNPQFADIDTVISKEAVESLVEEAAIAYSNQAKIPLANAELQVKTLIWKQANPYEYLYGFLKGKGKGKESTPSQVQKPKEPIKAPASLEDFGGSSTAKTTVGWTAARIDALPEDELYKVPKDVYESYMRNELK